MRGFLLLFSFTFISCLYAEYQKIKWEDLIPDNNAFVEKEFRKINWDEISEDDDRMQRKIESILERAPIDKNFDGKDIEIAGYLLPLDYGNKLFKEFFLLPYFGACIHSPPPPANQIIYVKTDRGLGSKYFDGIVEVKGKLSVGKRKNELGSAGYTMKMEKIELQY